jgi:hypothetical protein
MKVFGFEFKKVGPASPVKSFVPPMDEPEVATISAAGHVGHYVDIDGSVTRNDSDLILRYRQIAEQPEVDSAISKITNEAIATSEVAAPVSIRISDSTISKSVKLEISSEFTKILSLLDFNASCTDIFRKWYVDGKMFYHIVINPSDPKQGIQELRTIDPCRIQKVREVKRETDRATGAEIESTVADYYVYSMGMVNSAFTTVSTGSSLSGLKIATDSIVFVPSGLLDSSRTRHISHLHKAIKPTNQLRMLEDAMVIYRYSRAPERRIFYIDTGTMAKGKAEEYVRSVMANYRNKLVYDANTGEIKDDRKHMSMLEDFWLPRREGGKGTEITTLPGGDGMDQTDHMLFFKKKLMMSLNVPISRLDNTAAFQFGRTNEISREEVEFQRFIDAVRKKFSQLFLDLLRVQLILKRIISDRDWNFLKEKISIDFLKDNYFTEIKEIELLKERVATVDALQPYVGKYFSQEYIRRIVLRQTDEEVKRIAAEIQKEANPEVDPDEGKEVSDSAENTPDNLRASNRELGIDDLESSDSTVDGKPDFSTPDDKVDTYSDARGGASKPSSEPAPSPDGGTEPAPEEDDGQPGKVSLGSP